MDAIVVHAVQMFDDFQLVLYPYTTTALEHPPATLGDLIFDGY